jgi:hypothetical protein
LQLVRLVAVLVVLVAILVLVFSYMLAAVAVAVGRQVPAHKPLVGLEALLLFVREHHALSAEMEIVVVAAWRLI